MPTNFPTSLDTFPTAADLSDDTLATKPHSTTHGNLGDAVLAVQTKVGVDNSGVTSTFDYRIRAIENGRAAANGYASLDANTRVPTAQLASGTPVNGYAPVYNGTTVAWAEVTQSNELVDEKDLLVRAGVDGDGIWWNAFEPLQVVESATPGQSVRTTVAGWIFQGGYKAYVAAGTVSLSAAHATLPRYDLVVAYRSGTLGKVDGTAAATPTPPAVPAYAVGLAWVYRAANDNTVSNAEITDIRVKYTTDQYPTKQAVRFYEFPEPTGGEYAYNSSLHTGPQLWTGLHGLTYKQWAVFVAGDTEAVACQRSLPYGEWTSVNLMAITDSPFGTATTGDEHNTYAVAVSPTNLRVHVIGNMHNSNMDNDANHDTYYARGGINWSTSLSYQTMDGTASELDSVTYPVFFAQSDGKLYFLHRDGTSGGPADTILRTYDPGAGTWSKAATFTSDASWSAYHWWPAVDRWAHNTGSTLDRIHLFWCWRSTTDEDTNEDFYHAYSDDDGATWKQLSDGSTITTPIGKSETKGRIFDSGQPPIGDAGSWNILNNGGACVDIYGRPHAVVYMGRAGDRNTQALWHIYWNGTAWVTTELGDFTTGTSRSALFATRNGGIWCLYSTDYNEQRGTIRLLDLNPYDNTDDYGKLSFAVAGPHVDTVSWTPSFDPEAIWLLNELHIPLFFETANPNVSSYIHASNWNSQWGGVLTVDLDQLDKFAAGTVRLPGIEILGTVSADGPDITVVQTSAGDIGVGQFAVTAAYQAQSQVFGRLRAKGSRVGSNSCSVQMLETTIAGTTAALGRVEFNSGTADDAETPWVPLRTVTGTTLGHLGVQSWVGASTIGTVHELTMDVGRWTLPREWT